MMIQRRMGGGDEAWFDKLTMIGVNYKPALSLPTGQKQR